MRLSNGKGVFVLALSTFLFYIAYSWGLAITDPVESNYALTAKEMLQNGSFISPMIFGHSWYDKPPLTYWFLMLSFKIFGFTNFAARLPAALTATASVVAIYYSAKVLLKNSRMALWSALALGTTFEFWYISHAVVTDGYLFLASIGIFTWSYLAFTEQKKSYMRYAYMASAVAVLAKGPVGIVLPGMVLILFLLLRRKKSDLAILFDPLGILLFALIAFPWYIAMTAIHGKAFLEGFLGLHNVTRATISEHPEQNVWWYYFALTPLALLPWIGLTIYEGAQSIKNNALRQFQWLWFGTVFLFYTLVATKYITYTFIGFIPLALMNGQGMVRLLESNRSRKAKLLITAGPGVFFAFILTIGAYFEPHMSPLLMALVTMMGIAMVVTTLKLERYCIPATALSLALLIFLALPPTITPLVNVRTAEKFTDQVASYEPERIYFYYDYATSYSFYTGIAPVRLLDTVHFPMDVWDKGKDVMPSVKISTLNEHYLSTDKKERTIIVVPPKFQKEFTSFEFTKDFHKIGHYGDRYDFYANYKIEK